MAFIDSDIYFKEQAPDILGSMEKGAKLSLLAKQNKLAQQELDDKQAVRDALTSNTITNPDGTTTLNRQGSLSDLAQSAPTKGIELQQQFMQQDANAYQMQIKKRSDQADLIGRAAGAIRAANYDQGVYVQTLQDLRKNGVDISTFPAQVDKNLVDSAYMQSMNVKDQMNFQNQQVEIAIKKQNAQAETLKARAQAAEAGIPYGGGGGGTGAAGNPQAGIPYGGGGGGGAGGAAGNPQAGNQNSFVSPPKMQAKAVQDYTSSVNGSRQEPDAVQSLKDIQASQKLSKIVNQAAGGDLNKLNPQQTKLAIMEVVKMAGGGVPTEGELESMTPDNLAQKYAETLQKLTNRSQPANAGQFIQQGIDYANEIATVGAGKLADRANDMADRGRKFLGEDNYKTIKAQISSEYQRNLPPQKAGKSGVMSFEQWKASKGSGP